MRNLQLPDQREASRSSRSDPSGRQHRAGSDTGINVVKATKTVTDSCRWTSEVNERSQASRSDCCSVSARQRAQRNRQNQDDIQLWRTRLCVWLQLVEESKRSWCSTNVRFSATHEVCKCVVKMCKVENFTVINVWRGSYVWKKYI